LNPDAGGSARRRLAIEFTIDVRAAKTRSRLLTKAARTDNVIGGVETDGADLLVAACERRDRGRDGQRQQSSWQVSASTA
jgi:hypothetical protein